MLRLLAVSDAVAHHIKGHDGGAVVYPFSLAAHVNLFDNRTLIA